MTNDASGEEEETTTYRTPFGVEVDMRESHLAALPGKVDGGVGASTLDVFKSLP
jgi:hypothetical protein